MPGRAVHCSQPDQSSCRFTCSRPSTRCCGCSFSRGTGSGSYAVGDKNAPTLQQVSCRPVAEMQVVLPRLCKPMFLGTTDVKPFTNGKEYNFLRFRVAICSPMVILVEPATQYQVTIDAEATVRSAITTLVDEGTLLVEASSFSTNNPIKVTVGLPAQGLTSVTNRGAYPGVVAPGFNASKLTINAQGASELTVVGLTVETLVVASTG